MRQIENLGQKQRTLRVWDTYETKITAFPKHQPYKEFIVRYTYLDFDPISWQSSYNLEFPRKARKVPIAILMRWPLECS